MPEQSSTPARKCRQLACADGNGIGPVPRLLLLEITGSLELG